MHKYYFDISSLVGKYLAGNLNDLEKADLNDWLARSEENQKWFAHITTDQYKAQKLRALREVDTLAGWNSLQIRAKRKRTGKITFRRTWLKYAAFLAIPVVLAILLRPRPMDTREPETNAIETILPGSGRATLVLSDGKAVSLGEAEQGTLQTETGTIINLDKDRLIYESTPEPDDSRLVYNELIVPRGGEYSLALADGTEVFLNAGSRLKFPVVFGKADRIVELEGEAYFKVTDRKESPFIVKTGGMDVEVLGTEFNVSAYPGDPGIQTTVITGSVRAVSVASNQSVVLSPGQQAELSVSEGRLNVMEADVSFIVAWRLGRLRFREKPLGEIMKMIERWYDVEVVYEDPELKDYVFGCNFSRYSTIEPLMKVFEATGTIHATIEGRKIKLSKAKKAGGK